MIDNMNILGEIAMRHSDGMRKLAALVAGGNGMPKIPSLPAGPKGIPGLGKMKQPNAPSGKPSTTISIKADGDGVQALKEILGSRQAQQMQQMPQ